MAGSRRYDLLAVDLDGTLIGPDGRISDENVEAIGRAREAGLEVVVCTGRAMVESAAQLERIGGRRPASGRAEAPMICVGGAMVCDTASGRTLYRRPMGRRLVSSLCDHFAEHRRAPLLLKDRDAAGFDYLVVDSGPIEHPTRWWFEHMDVEVKFVPSIEADDHPEHTVRVGFAAVSSVMHELAASVHERFGGEAVTQHFSAVAGGPQSAGALGIMDETVHLLEVFDPQVNKWTGIGELARRHEIEPSRIAAIGDEVNDVAMIDGAALGIAVGNAVPSVKAVADVEAPSHGEHAVAFAIERILDGSW